MTGDDFGALLDHLARCRDELWVAPLIQVARSIAATREAIRGKGRKGRIDPAHGTRTRTSRPFLHSRPDAEVERSLPADGSDLC